MQSSPVLLYTWIQGCATVNLDHIFFHYVDDLVRPVWCWETGIMCVVDGVLVSCAWYMGMASQSNILIWSQLKSIIMYALYYRPLSIESIHIWQLLR